MKQLYGMLGLIAIFLLLIGAVTVYAYNSTNNSGFNMMGNTQGTYNGMMGNIDPQTRAQMNTLHDQMIKNLDPETAKQMDAMHDSCMGNNDNNPTENT